MSIFKFTKIRIQKSKEVIKAYKKARTKEKKNKDTKKVVRAVDNLVYELIKIWNLHIIIPALSVFVLLLHIFKLYGVQILAIGFLGYAVYDHFKKPEVDKSHKYYENHIWLQENLYGIFKIIECYLPIRKILNPLDLVNYKRFNVDHGIGFYFFNLMKTTSEEIEKEKVEFAKRIFEAELIKLMDHYEELYNNGCTYFKDERIYTLDRIKDFGSHYQFRILKIDNIQTYNYLKNKKNKSYVNKNINRKDSDF